MNHQVWSIRPSAPWTDLPGKTALFIPSGQFERTTRSVGKIKQTVVVPDSYEGLPKHFSLKGLSNMIIPTSGVLMAMLGLAEIPYEKWVRFLLPLFLYLCVIAFVILGVAVATGY